MRIAIWNVKANDSAYTTKINILYEVRVKTNEPYIDWEIK